MRGPGSPSWNSKVLCSKLSTSSSYQEDTYMWPSCFMRSSFSLLYKLTAKVSALKVIMKEIWAGIRHLMFLFFCTYLLLSLHHNTVNKNSVNWFYVFTPSLTTHIFQASPWSTLQGEKRDGIEVKRKKTLIEGKTLISDLLLLFNYILVFNFMQSKECIMLFLWIMQILSFKWVKYPPWQLTVKRNKLYINNTFHHISIAVQISSLRKGTL